MGTITSRKRKSGTRYTAQIRIKRDGLVVHSEAETFDKHADAKMWMRRREAELDASGTLAQKNDPILKDTLNKYIAESVRHVGRTKAQVLRTISASSLGKLPCSKVTSTAIVDFATGLGVLPQTTYTYLSHLGAVFQVAKPAWGYPLEMDQLDSARQVLKRLGATGKSFKRSRRPTAVELDKILTHFWFMQGSTIPMVSIIVFALYSTRRQEEITRLRWNDIDLGHEDGDRVLVRDMKNPGQKIGNDTLVDLPPECVRVIKRMPRVANNVFPYNSKSISGAFTRACSFLGIDDLHFHDLRHEGISRLFEMGWSIPHVSAVSGHRSWSSLQRYTHLRKAGDRWANWTWLELIDPLPPRPGPARLPAGLHG